MEFIEKISSDIKYNIVYIDEFNKIMLANIYENFIEPTHNNFNNFINNSPSLFNPFNNDSSVHNEDVYNPYK